MAKRIPLAIVLAAVALLCVWLAWNADPGVVQQTPYTLVDGEFRRNTVHLTTKEAEAFWRDLGVHEAADAYEEDLKAIEKKRMLYSAGALVLTAAAILVLRKPTARAPYKRRRRALEESGSPTASSSTPAKGPGHDYNESGV